MRTPNFTQVRQVLSRQCPDRPTLFEFFLNGTLFRRLTGIQDAVEWGTVQWCTTAAKAYAAAGYDYVTIQASNFSFPTGKHEREKSISQNEGVVITDRGSFSRYEWPNPDAADYSRLDASSSFLPNGMKLIIWGPGGVAFSFTPHPDAGPGRDRGVAGFRIPPKPGRWRSRPVTSRRSVRGGEISMPKSSCINYSVVER